jgi:hypothetical protein
MSKGYITILTEVYNCCPKEGIEYLTYNVRVALDIDDIDSKYDYNCGTNKEKAYSLAEKIHRDQRTDDLIHLTA